MSDRGEVTRVLEDIREGDADASSRLLPLVYEEMRRLARARMAGLPPGGTLQPTALVHEAYLKLVGPDGEAGAWDNRAHFFGAAATAMRNILVDAARRRGAAKRGGGAARVPLEDAAIVEIEPPTERMLALDRALDALERRDERAHRIVMLRYFAGLTEAQIGEALGVSERTVRREWSHARSWLQREMRDDEREDGP